MPPTLHPYLKRGLDLDTSPVHPSDLVEDLPADHYDEECQTAKRRRVEAIALQYLRGKPPLILTARLKGPFTKEWRNPWTQDGKGRIGGHAKGIDGRDEKQVMRKSKASHVASPEASRALGHHEEHLYSQATLEPLAGTAPLPDGDDLSCVNEFFSVDTEQFITNNSPVNPFWLRRPAASMAFPPNSQADKSPTKPRRKDHRLSSRKSLQLAPPKGPLGDRPLPIRSSPSDVWRSSASATMDISPAVGPATPASLISKQSPRHHTPSTEVPDSSRLRADSAQEDEARSSQAAQHAQTLLAATSPTGSFKEYTIMFSGVATAQPIHAQSFDSLVPATTYKISSTVQVPQSSPLRALTGATSIRKFPRHEEDNAVPRDPSPQSRLTSEAQLSPCDYEPAEKNSMPKKLRHNLVASPAPASSTGFMYRKVTQTKSEGSNITKVKPRAVSFSSSPTHKNRDRDQLSITSEVNVSTTANGVPPCTVPSVSAEALNTTGGQIVDEEAVQQPWVDRGGDEQQQPYKSRQSQYSTQAAMLLAQLEFQEDLSQSSSSSTTLRPWSQPARNTPQALLPQPSPAITPLSVFNAHKDEGFGTLAEDNTLHGPSISTQDLFDAASPFAFSTVKKKNDRSRRTSLRSALTSNFRESIVAECPTPSTGRVPLKEKNVPTVWSFVHDKTSSGQTKRPSQSARQIPHEVELPQLEFHTSLDFGPNTDFTDYFLRGLDNEP